jgi:hypothetical protein
MNHHHDINRTSWLLLAFMLGACTPPAEGGTETEDESESDSEDDTSTTEVDPTEVDPTIEGTETTVTPTTEEPTTAGPTTVEPTTAGPTTVDPTTEGDTESTTDTSTGEPLAELTAVWATANPTGLSADALVGLSPALDANNATYTLVGDVISIQSLAYDMNDAFITYDAPSGGGIIIADNLPNNLMAAPIGLGTRQIVGVSTGLVAPKGIEATGPDGTIIVADTGAPAIHVFAGDADGDAAPVYSVIDFGPADAVWDIHYVAATDTLFAAGTTGQLLIYDTFSVMMGAAGPDRVVVPTENGSQISVNLHGITVAGDLVFLSDVGDPANGADGQLFVLSGAETIDGDVDVDQRIQGGDLGNPVDLELRAGITADTLYVAEKSNDKLLVFTENLVSGDFEAGATLDVVKPESIAIRTATTLLLAQNSAGVDTDGALLVNTPAVGAPTAGAVLNQIGSVTSIQSLALALDGRGFVGFDGPVTSGGGGVFVVDGLTGLTDMGTVDAVANRLWGPETGIVTPKGIALNAAQDRLFVADTAAANIKVFDANNLGNVEPLFIIDDLGGGAVWDVAYDDASDRLYAAGVDGVVRVFDGALAAEGQDPPARTITPTDGTDKISVNLHGIAYDAATDTLLLSDVGDAMVTDDGALFVIADAATADDMVEVKAAIRGAATLLGNPVDIAFDGADLYVAEKSNSAVQRYDGVLDLSGVDNDLEANATIEVQNAESVQLFFSVP